MVRDAQDNEPNPWSAIGLQATLIVNKLRVQAQLTDTNKEKNVEKNGNADTNRNRSDAGKAPEKHTGEKAAEIERRVRDILAMANRLRRKRI